MKGVQCYELFGGIAFENYAFSFFPHFFPIFHSRPSRRDSRLSRRISRLSRMISRLSRWVRRLSRRVSGLSGRVRVSVVIKY